MCMCALAPARIVMDGAPPVASCMRQGSRCCPDNNRLSHHLAPVADFAECVMSPRRAADEHCMPLATLASSKPWTGWRHTKTVVLQC